MSETTGLVTRPNGATEITARPGFSRSNLELLKRTVAKGLDDDEFELFAAVAAKRGLDPFVKQVYAIKRYDKSENRKVMTIQTGIDGYRLIAERTGKYLGQSGPFWCGDDGEWRDVWLDGTEPPFAAKVGVYKAGLSQPIYAVARWSSYAQESPFWKKMPDSQLAKCAEALALRKAFPEELAGIYTDAEMDQADNRDDVNHTTGEITEAKQVDRTPERLAPAKPFNRKAAEERYYALIDKADSLDIPVKAPLNPKWSEDELKANGRALAQLVADREADLESQANREQG